MLKMAVVRAIAKRFVFRKAAAANADNFPARQVVRCACFVNYFKIALNTQ